MTTAFQTVFDYAESISINKKRKVAQTISREGVVRAVSLGGAIWEFEVNLPNGLSWQTFRPLIERMEALDRVSTATVKISNPKLNWLSGYQGDLRNITASIVVSYSTGSTVNIVSAPSLTAGFRFRSGDFIQLGANGRVYSVVNDVAWSTSTVTLNRPVTEATGTYTLFVGQDVTWSVRCVEFPQWDIYSRNQVSWSGPFRFAEVN